MGEVSMGDWRLVAIALQTSLLLTSFFRPISDSEAAPPPSSFWPSIETISKLSSDQAQDIARSGEVLWNVSESEKMLKRYRAWLNWETSSPQPLETLNDPSALRRIMINSIEREVMSRHARHELSQHKTLSTELLRAWIMELIPGSMRPTKAGLDDFVRGRLKMRAGSDLSFFWEAAEDAYWVQALKDKLVDDLEEEDARQEWLRQGTLIKVWLLQVPRVPTSDEITLASSRYTDEIKTYYNEHLELFSQPLRLLVTPFWVKGGKLEAQRLEAIEIQSALVKGESLDQILELHPTLTRGSSKTLRGRSIPENTEIKEGAFTPTRLTRYGWTFYQINRVYPEYVRSINERSVQREVAAAVLREKDDLPRAQALSKEAEKLLRENNTLEALNPWARRSRVRLSSPDPFFESSQGMIPTIGLAPELQERLFSVNVGEVTEPIAIRQHYVIAKLVEKRAREEEWSVVKKDYLESWKLRRAPQVLDEWLTVKLKDAPRWVNTKLLEHFSADALRFESDLPPLDRQE